MLTINNILWILIMHQIWIYRIKLHKEYFDIKMIIFYLCAANQFNVWFHYNFMGKNLLGKTFFLFDISRFIIFFLIFYYYCQKAGKLLPNKKNIMLLLKVVFIVCLNVIICLGIGIWVYINDNKEAAKALCNNQLFESYRYSSLVMCFIFLGIFYYITKSVEESKNNNQGMIEKTIYQLQIKALRKLKISIIFVVIFTIYTIGWDIFQSLNGDLKNCNAIIFNNFLDTIFWLISRGS